MFGRDIVSETDITITLAEHLLGKLAPGHTYVIDHRVKGKGKCECGCGVQPNFGSTGIGMYIYSVVNSGFCLIFFTQLSVLKILPYFKIAWTWKCNVLDCSYF